MSNHALAAAMEAFNYGGQQAGQAAPQGKQEGAL